MHFYKICKITTWRWTFNNKCCDNNCLDLPVYSKAQAIKYGIENDDVVFKRKILNLMMKEWLNLMFINIRILWTYFTFYPGKHNIFNALACYALCDTYGFQKLI